MQKKRYVWSILPGLFLLIGVVAGYGSGCNGTVVGPEDEIPTVDTDAFDPNGDGGSTGEVTCATLNANCGLVEDGKGGTLDCGTCTAPQTCGGGGTFFQCGGSSGCVPKTTAEACAVVNANCGEAADGCGGTVSCGTCTAPQTCGGGGTAFQCGSGGGSCTPTTCAAVNANCGMIGDGCGGTLNCGTCTAPQTCGGGGTAGRCGQPMCTPIASCAAANANCGFVGDGCGGIIGGATGPGCGSCPSGQTCGGAGMANKCGVPAPVCQNLCLKQVKCDGGSTTLTGTVTAPGHDNTATWGTADPIPNALVYVPNGTVMPFTAGVTCDQCGSDVSGSPLVSTTTGIDGKFTLTDVPCGVPIPVVVQLGRWRRQITVPAVACCSTTALTTTQTRLPRNKTEGDIPKIAVVTGSADPMECVLPKIGIDTTEFTEANGTGRVNFFRANGATISGTTPTAASLFADLNTMKKYDLIILDCEGSAADKSAYYNNLLNYTAAGGRIYVTHYGYSFLHGRYQTAPPALNTAWDATATWKVDQAAPPNQNAIIDQSFPKGKTFATWLKNVAGGTLGQIPVTQVRHDFNAVVAPSQQWMYGTQLTSTKFGNFPMHYTFNAPVGAMPANQCGRVMYSDFHVSTGATGTGTFPAECNLGTGKPLTAQEKVLEYMLFDLTSCIKADVPMCTPKTCAMQGYNCGQQGDGCGGILNCGTCTSPNICGGGGVPGVCGGACTPLTCAGLGYSCGTTANGCGGTLNCGTCTAPQVCGGGGAGKCGTGACIPKTCANLGLMCGAAGDGCGGTLNCGSCPAGQTCGGGGVSGACGVISCTPRTCASVGAECGTIGDGCGATLNCGMCAANASCGVFTPNKCGVVG